MSFIKDVFPFAAHQILTALLTLVRRLQKANRASLYNKGLFSMISQCQTEVNSMTSYNERLQNYQCASKP